MQQQMRIHAAQCGENTGRDLIFQFLMEVLGWDAAEAGEGLVILATLLGPEALDDCDAFANLLG